MSGEWLFLWKCFISNKVSASANAELKSKVNYSSNKEIGILPPGPISNQSFFSKDKIVDGLVLNKDYRGVNSQVWKLLKKIYGGGPAIVRAELDIYSKDKGE